LLAATDARVVLATVIRWAQLEPTTEKDLYFLDPAGPGPRAFFLDAGGVIMPQLQSWIKLARRKWRGIITSNDPTAVSLSITGTPKVRVCADCCTHCKPRAPDVFATRRPGRHFC
jgi:hypothetical protein